MISIHVPRVEDDGRYHNQRNKGIPFQSTSPVWRTTFIYDDDAIHIEISIHVPRVEDDSELPRRNTHTSAFQSTSPVWRTTAKEMKVRLTFVISIHVPRVEDDIVLVFDFLNREHFNPRPPCGGRPKNPENLFVDYR